MQVNQLRQVDSTPNAGDNPNWNKAVSKALGNQPDDNSLGPDTKRPQGDFRTAQQIIDDNPLLKNLGNQSGVKDTLRERVGDFEHDPDAAYRASRVLEHIENSTKTASLPSSGQNSMRPATARSTALPKAVTPATAPKPGACRISASTAGRPSKASCRIAHPARRPRAMRRPTICRCRVKAGRWATTAVPSKSLKTTRC